MTEEENEEETFFSKRLLQATVSEDVVDIVKKILDVERVEAKRTDRVKPSLSGTVEMLLRKGIKGYYLERQVGKESEEKAP